MATERIHFIPDRQVCEQARWSRDPRFDGLFFTAVTSTRIYCRPVCPVPTVKSSNVVYYGSAAAAEAAGYRPCLRCRPELAPGAWARGDSLVERALKLIDQGFLAERPLAALAERIGVGERQLRRLFTERIGASPLGVHLTRRLLFAKQLLTETDLPVTHVALEAGFGSLRRFNSSFRKAYRLSPSEIRRTANPCTGDALVLHLAYRPPFDFASLLDELRRHALPGIEVVDADSYSRTFGSVEAPGWLRVSASPGRQHSLQLQVYCQQASRILDVVQHVRRMFDLDADPEIIESTLSQDPQLRHLVEHQPGLRLPGSWDGFETAVRTVLEQHAGTENAAALAARLAERFGYALDPPYATGLVRLFPTPEVFRTVDPGTMEMPSSCTRVISVIRDIVHGLLEGELDFKPERALEDFIARWSAVPGIDNLTAHTIAMRALGHPDAFPLDAPVTHPELDIESRHASWRPWRAYAAMHIRLDAERAGDASNPQLRHREVAIRLERRTP